jgi:hypothetical protein
MMHLLLFALTVTGLWLLSLLVHPFGKCPLCRGKRVRVSKRRRKARKCWVCKGKGRRQRPGSRTVHRVRRNAVAGWKGWRAEQ